MNQRGHKKSRGQNCHVNHLVSNEAVIACAFNEPRADAQAQEILAAAYPGREIVGVVGPNYYSSGTNVMTPQALEINEWNDLEGRPVCGKQGAFYNQIVEERHGAEIIAFGSNAEALQALRDQKCIAWVYDDSSIAADLAETHPMGLGAAVDRTVAARQSSQQDDAV